MESTDISEHYISRVRLFRNEPIVQGQTVFLGDSITEGGDWGTLLGSSNTLNRGISGDTTVGVLQRIEDVVGRHPGKLFLMIGVNDIGSGTAVETVFSNCRLIVEQVQEGSPDTNIFVQSILPVNPNHPGLSADYHKQEEVYAANALLASLVASHGIHYVDLHPAFSDDGQYLDLRLTDDGLHLNRAGYLAWASFLLQNHLAP